MLWEEDGLLNVVFFAFCTSFALCVELIKAYLCNNFLSIAITPAKSFPCVNYHPHGILLMTKPVYIVGSMLFKTQTPLFQRITVMSYSIEFLGQFVSMCDLVKRICKVISG